MTINFNKAEFVLSATTQNAFIRDGRPQVTFAGRSNVGKSSVINRLLNRKNFARVGATPGKTSQVNYFPRHAAGPLLRREGRRQDGGAVPAEPVLRLSMFRIPLPFPAGGYPHPATGVPYPTTGYPPRRSGSGTGSASGAEGNFHQILYEKIVFFLNCDTIRWNETAPCGQKAPVRKNSADKSVPSGTERRFLL